jgi:AraC-like DNA-binding protein
MPRVLALLPHPAAAERLRLALPPHDVRTHACDLAFVRAWDELLRQARTQPPDLVVFDPDAGVDACEDLRTLQPAVALLPYGRFDGARARVLLRLSDLGVRDVVIRGQDDEPPSIRARVAELLSRRFPDDVSGALNDLFPQALRPLLRYLLLNAGTPLDPARAARSQFCHPKTLRAHLRRGGLPSLNRLIVWTRLFHAAHLLAGTGRSVSQAAGSIGYPSAAALRVQVHRYAGLAVRDLRGPCGLRRLLGAFRARCGADAGSRAADLSEA